MVVDTVFADEGETLEEAYTKWRGWAEDQACCDYALKVALPSKIDNTVLSEMETLSSEEYGVNTFCIDMINVSACYFSFIISEHEHWQRL